MAIIIAEELKIENFDEKNLKCCCPFHVEDTPSFIWNSKALSFRCFGACGRSYDIIDIFMMNGRTYIEAVQKLFELANIKYAFGEHRVKTNAQYKYPKGVPVNDKSKITAYYEKRKIRKKTLDYADVREDDNGNIVFNYYDLNDTLCMVKFRPSRIIKHGEIKNWCEKGSDTMPLLFNMNRINTDSPLLICSGESDALAAIEAGYTNAVSIPLGDQNTHWVEHCWDFLEQFDNIIICADNDTSGMKFQKDIVYRLGSWRTKLVDLPTCYIDEKDKKWSIKDLNEVLYWFGKDIVLETILNAKDSPVDSVSDFSDIKNVDLNDVDGITTGIKELDKNLMKLFYGTFNIVTGVNGCVDSQTEYFNGLCWKSIAEYQVGEKVLQYAEDGTASLVDPQKYHKYPCDKFWLLQSKYGVNQCVSDEHNLVYLTSKGNIQKKNMLDLLEQHKQSKHGFHGNFITTFNYTGTGIALTDEEIRVMCAVVCDGNIVERIKTDDICRINIKKERKKNRLRELLDNAHIKYSIHHYNPSDYEYETFMFVPPLATKSFSLDWYSCTQNQLEIIADEILNWDGSVKGGRRRFSITNKQTADYIQFVFTACGYRSVITINDRVGQKQNDYIRKSIEYAVHITSQIHPSIFNVKNKINIPKVNTSDGFKYCFTVPSGMLVLRRNGRINITGNSGKSSFLSQLVCESLDQGKNAFLYSGELPNFQSKNWINYILAGQRHLREYKFNETVYWKVTNEAQDAMNEYYKGRLFIFKDGYDHKVPTLMKSIEDTVRKYGVKLIILDNLTSINLECNDNNKYNKQEELVSQLIDFAKKFNVAVILVVHPHKIETMRRLTKMDVQGISAIIDLAHRIISLYRVQAEDKKGKQKNNGKGWYKEPIKYDVLCDVLKDRMLGFEGSTIGLYYDKPSRRFFTNEEHLDHGYAWDKGEYSGRLPFPPTQLNQSEADREVYGYVTKE